MMASYTSRRCFLALALAAALCAPAASAAKKPARPAPDPLRERIEAVLHAPDAWRAHWGIKVVSLESGKTLFALNEQKFFTPASNTKLFTTALALATLGPQFRFRTTVEVAVAPDKYGRVAGDLWLVGRGDPNLSSRVIPYTLKTERNGPPLRVLEALADQIVSRGIRYVEGDLVADDSYFVLERYGEGWSVDDMMWWFGAPVSALSVNDNVLFVDILPGEKPGDRALVQVEPSPDYYRVENRVVTVEARGRRPERSGSGGDDASSALARQISLRREPGSHTLEIWGRIPADDRGVHHQVAIEDPALFAGKYLREALLQRGVMVYGQVRSHHAHPSEFEDLKNAPPAPPSGANTARQVLARYDSEPLVEDLKVINKVSQNLHAEMVLRTVGGERRHIGSVAAGLEEMKAFLSRAGVPPEEWLFYDGSGLSRRNLVTPAAIVALLKYMDGEGWQETWRSLLPVAGEDGSISERFKDSVAAGRILAKTGTLGHVSALSGYATTLKGERLAFAIMVNNHNLPVRQVTSLIDRICLAVAEK